MKKERSLLKNGDIVEFPVPHTDEFGYAKYVDMSIGYPDEYYYNPSRWFVYNYFSKNRIEYGFNPTGIEYLCNPLLMYWYRSIKKLEGWRIVGNDILTSDYKKCYLRFFPVNFWKTDPAVFSELTWMYCLEPNDSLNKAGNWTNYPYEKIRHLEDSGNTPVDNLPGRAYIEKCKALAMDVDVRNLTKGEWYAGYLLCLDIPAYNIIPEEYRQVPIPLDSDWKWPESSKLYFNYYDREK